jgi:hypothetical protein
MGFGELRMRAQFWRTCHRSRSPMKKGRARSCDHVRGPCTACRVIRLPIHGQARPRSPEPYSTRPRKTFEPIRSGGELIDGCDALIVQTVPSSTWQQKAPDGTFPALLVVIGHGLDLSLFAYQWKLINLDVTDTQRDCPETSLTPLSSSTSNPSRDMS